MIAANSFRMDCKMEPPVHRLKLPDLTDKAFQARKKNRINPQKINHSETDKDSRLNQGNWKRGYQIRKPNYLLGQPQGVQSTLQEQARIQLANRHQSQLNASVDAATTNTTPSMAQPTDTSASSVLTTTMEPTTALSNDQEGTTLVMDDGSGGLVSAEEGKQLVSIGDGQYVELPEGYTLIQTDDGYIIGQPGATFVQGGRWQCVHDKHRGEHRRFRSRY
uniref:Uncharacterized protein n=1 Tax=Ciona savignyi TaxID=51511 RepID=H2YZI1_CIOSA